MANEKKAKETTDAGTLGRLSKAGEDAVTRLFDELGKNERVTDALGKAMSAKGKVDESAKKALGQVGLAADELEGSPLAHRTPREAPRQARVGGQACAEAEDDHEGEEDDGEVGLHLLRARSVGGGTARGSGAGGTGAT